MAKGRSTPTSMKDNNLISFGRILVLLGMIKEEQKKNQRTGKVVTFIDRDSVAKLTDKQKKEAVEKVALELGGWLNAFCTKMATTPTSATAKLSEAEARIAELEARLEELNKGKKR